MFAISTQPGNSVFKKLRLSFISCIALLLTFSTEAQQSGQLPVNLKTFKARAETNNRVKIFWTTVYEKDNGFFDIERSGDGINFTRVGRVAGVNLNGHLTDYVFYDYNALKGISFYRLKQVDIDQVYSYSPIERVRNTDAEISLDIYPNPSAQGQFTINVLKNETGMIDVNVFDQMGRLQLQQRFSNNNTMTVAHQLAAGIYRVKITGKELDESRTIVVQ